MKELTQADTVLYAGASDVRYGRYYFDVYCDGQKLKFCKEANAAEGWAVCFKADERWKKYLIRDGIHCATPTTLVRGSIRIVPRLKDDDEAMAAAIASNEELP